MLRVLKEMCLLGIEPRRTAYQTVMQSHYIIGTYNAPTGIRTQALRSEGPAFLTTKLQGHSYNAIIIVNSIIIKGRR